MKVLFSAAALAVCAIALPASAQPAASSDAWWNPLGYVHNGYVGLDGGITTEGRVNRTTMVEGVGATKVEGGLSDDVFGSALFGHNFNSVIAGELEGFYAYDHFNFDNSNAVAGERSRRAYGGFGNVKLRAPFAAHVWSLGINPYVAGGIGYGDVEYTGPLGNHGAQDGFIWQGKAGLEVKTGTPVSFDLGYRYIQAPDYSTHGEEGLTSTLIRSNVQAATVGVRYTF